jgi:hypothetical protein
MRSSNTAATAAQTVTINSAVTFNSGPNTTTFTVSGSIPGNGLLSIASVTKGQNSQLVGAYNFTGPTGHADVLLGLLNNQTGGTVDPVTGAVTGAPVAASTIGRLANAVGIANTTSGDYSTAFGWSNTTSATGAYAIGSFITNGIASSTMIGSGDRSKLTILGSTGQ